jgi:hypothetical protein
MGFKHRRVAVLRVFSTEIQMPQHIYSSDTTREIAGYVDNVAGRLADGASHTDILDSVSNESGFNAPEPITTIAGLMTGEDATRYLDSITEGIQVFHREHGTYPTADLVEAMVQQSRSALFAASDEGFLRGASYLDSATSIQHDQGSLQPNRAIVAMLSGMAEAIPWASYLPVDIGSNEAKLIIGYHMAGSNFGDYKSGDIMDGVDLGGSYISAMRLVRFDTAGTLGTTFPVNRKFSDATLSSERGYCDPAATGVPVLRGRTVLYVNGIEVARDQMTGTTSTSSFSASFKNRKDGVTYTIAGSVTVATGAVSITSCSPTLPAGNTVIAAGVIDFESAPGLIPKVLMKADPYKLYANANRVMTEFGIDAATQFRNEAGLDPESEGLLAMRAQSSAERHYLAMRLAYELAGNNVVDHDLDYANRSAQMNRSSIWLDALPVLGAADQNMANLTMDHGMTHIYGDAWLTQQWLAMPRDQFEPSGLQARAGIYRVGKLYGKYDCYYSPKIVGGAADGSTSTALAVGRSSNVARCPIVLGDAVSDTLLDLSRGQDLKKASALYSRNFTQPNPHEASALGCALLKFTGLK